MSSSFIRTPSYKNLRRKTKMSQLLWFQTRKGAICVKSRAHSPNAADVLSNFAGVCPLELAKLGAPLDLEENLFSSRAHNLAPITQHQYANSHFPPRSAQQRCRQGRTLMLIVAFASSTLGSACSWVGSCCSSSDMAIKLMQRFWVKSGL